MRSDVANYTRGPRILSVKHVIKGKQQLLISGPSVAGDTRSQI